MRNWMAVIAIGFVSAALVACGDDGSQASDQAAEASAEAQQAAEDAQQQVEELEEKLQRQEEAAKKEARKAREDAKDAKKESASEEASAPEPASEPPDVVGLTLPTAKQELKAAGFKADVSNTDTLFGILVPENYTVCKQDSPQGKVVPILAQKHGC